MLKSKNIVLPPAPQASAKLRRMRISPQKLNLVAQLVRKRTVAQAINLLSVCQKRAAHDVKKLLMSALANAENNHALDIDKLWVSRATVGSALTLKRVDFKGRSRTGRIRKPFSHMHIILEERKSV